MYSARGGAGIERRAYADGDGFSDSDSENGGLNPFIISQGYQDNGPLSNVPSVEALKNSSRTGGEFNLRE